MSSEKKQVRVLKEILDELGVKYKDSADIDTLKEKLETAASEGAALNKLDDEHKEILDELGYTIEDKRKKAKSDDEDDEKPKKKASKSDDDEEEKPKKKASKSDDDEDDAPKKKKSSDDDDDEKPTKKKAKDEDDEEEKPKKKAKASEDEDDEKPKKKASDDDEGPSSGEIKKWFQKYFEDREEIEDEKFRAAFEKKFGEEASEKKLHGYLYRAKTGDLFEDGSKLVTVKTLRVVKASKKSSKKDDDE